jgi:GntR family transcriptional regulator
MIYKQYKQCIEKTGGNHLKIIISNQSELPIYAQVREQIKEQILNGQIKEGEVLPSIRSMAKDLGVSVITTTRAYSDLEQEGFIATMQGKGSVVLSKDNNMLKEQFLMRIEQGIETAVESAKQIGMTKMEVQQILESVWEQ